MTKKCSKHIGKYKHRQPPTPHTCTYTERDLEGQWNNNET